MGERPNILLIMTDQQKATSLGLYGNPTSTNLARDPAYAETRAALERRLWRWSVHTEDAAPRPLFFDPATFQNSQTPFVPQAQE